LGRTTSCSIRWISSRLRGFARMATRITSSQLRRYSTSSSLLGIIAISLGIGSAAYLAGRSFTEPPAREHFKAYVPEYNVVEVPVPEKPVPAGVSLREVRVRLEKFPHHQLPSGVVRELSHVQDHVTLVPLPGGLPIMEANIGTADEATNPILGRIPPGMRAMTVQVDATSAVEGWARSGSIVDVLLVERSRTTVVAEAVKVISAERSLSAIDNSPTVGGGTGIPGTVTLLVTQEQCLAINTAVPLGKIAFALRSAKDDESWRATHFSSEELSGVKKSPEKARIGGVVAFGSGAERRQYALVDGAWIPADTVPSGFFVDSKRESKSNKAATTMPVRAPEEEVLRLHDNG
jgi:Flp pilus assembly protein CpaB